jgi:FAD/FMN-containing dehydrogenase
MAADILFLVTRPFRIQVSGFWSLTAGSCPLDDELAKIDIKADTEEEVAAILKAAEGCKIAVTFRAAGTSLSGHSVS